MIAPKTIVIIPHYNHSKLIGGVISALKLYDLPILIMDDGSALAERQRLAQFADENVHIFYLSENRGKGGAVKEAFIEAKKLGYTHAIQVDADGQHHLEDLPKFLACSQQYPESFICGKPIYDETAPKARLYGRKITDFWNMINTLSFDIKDGMCGFRLYPLKSCVDLIRHESIGERMDFDTEILVKAHWYQIPMQWIETPVRYNPNGISHFRGLEDNWLISKMHARLFLQMCWRKLQGKSV
ncbi:glycosyltransferase family 2 protein [Actinobacillus delphinicola]|uniref:Glycosyl transferase, group 2 family protein n=1 Tax=Actinobacillus delphinicola TaxID=51161 RepID=A0A448TVR3_9PAST|nr:glycosyltransferase family 2 protein [Actinobacillus delphinicola]VEJ10025.1 glycosyl transferase, group 2 family protein [Actinobacillus delphinicola]